LKRPVVQKYAHYYWLFDSVAVGIADLSNELMSYMADQRVFVIKTFRSSGGFCFSLERRYLRVFSVRVASSRDAIIRIVKQMEETGSVYDKLAKGRKRNAFDRMEVVAGATWE
jgi:hypothetical protein